VGAGIPGLLGQLPAILTLHRTEESLQIRQRLPARLGTKKAGANSLGDLFQLFRPPNGLRLVRAGHRH
jgi:hypothetical protein